VVIPTLAADTALIECLAALRAQTYRDFDVVVVDNSGTQAVRNLGIADANVRVIANASNLGFGSAVNQGWRASESPYIATINDDAQASPEWLAELVRAVERDPEIGLVASQVRLDGERLDSAGIVIGADGSSKQRGHGQRPADYGRFEDILLPSGSAALFRREMLEDTGGFDDDFFLYCEDTDLGLRARRRGWRAVYAPAAIVIHRYSHSAGRASELKAYYVERNRLFLLLKNFPARMLWRVPLTSAMRYLWHAIYMVRGRGAASEFTKESSSLLLPWFVLRAHFAVLAHLPSLIRKRRAIARRAYMNPRQFSSLLSRHCISAREVAAL
jgi:GT2 family glycosyltransferase